MRPRRRTILFVELTPATIAAKRRRLLGVLVMAGIAVLQLSSESLGTRDEVRTLSKTLALMVGLPILTVLATRTFRWAARNPVGLVGPLSVAAVVAGIFFAALLRAARAFTLAVVQPRPISEPYGQGDVLRVGFTMGLTYFALWALVYVFPLVVEDARVRGLEADKLRTQTELAQLRSHLEPHFILNTLNAIAGLVTEDPRQARQLLGNLGDLLRDAVVSGGEMQTLGEQIEWLRRYGEILATRHAGHLAFRWEIAAGAPRALLPRLLLQPLVENAVQHGALMRAGGGEITLRAEIAGPKLVCTIEDNGPGIQDKPIRTGAFGLLSVRRRLALRYPHGATLRIESSPAGTQSIVELPFEEEGGAPV
jgi:histidine kinase/histidine kinase/DNA gyrase B/HSP90-like ATPase